MKNELVIILAEDDEGHATLIKRNIRRAGMRNEILHFRDGEQTLDFLFEDEVKPNKALNYLLLLDIRMPKVDGITVLEKLRQDSVLKKIPVIIITTTDDPHEIERCYKLGCSNYVVKPFDYDKFLRVVNQTMSNME